MKTCLFLSMLFAVTWSDLWFTPDQQGKRLLAREEYAEAAVTFRDPIWQGVAWFRAGEFERAEQAFARVATSESEFNRGNCLIMRGKYEEAVERFDRALELRPGWDDACVNREIAIARAKLVEKKGGDMTGGEMEADEVVFDKSKNEDNQQQETQATEQLSDSEMQALWLRRVQTRPADFLKTKFAYQAAQSGAVEDAQ